MTYAEAVAAAAEPGPAGERSLRWCVLPEPVAVEDTTTVAPAAPVPAPGEPGDGHRNLLLWVSGS